MIKLIPIFFVLLTLQSCKSQQNISELENHFNKQQIDDLRKLTDFVITEVSQGKDFKSSLMNLDEEIANHGIEILLTRIDYQKQKEIIKSIDKSTYDEIWTECLTQDFRRDIEYYVLCSNGPDFEYQKYLHELGKRIPYVKEYAEKLTASGDLGHDFNFWYYYLSPEGPVNHSDFNAQLIFAIHILTLYDQLNN